MKVWEKIEKKQFSPLYLLYGTENFIINETKQKLVTNVLTMEEMDFNLSIYDLEETPIEEAIEDAETFPFMGEYKLLFLHNPVFLTAEKTKGKIEHDVKRLETYLQSPAPYSIVVFVGSFEKVDERKKITKLLKKSAEVLEAKPLNERELKLWVRDQANVSKVDINEDAIELFITLVGTDLMNLHSELTKLTLYVTDSKKIDISIVEKLTSRSMEQNIFDLVDKVVNRKMEEAFRIYYDLRKQNEEPIKILALIASQFRLIYQVKEMTRRGYGQQQIAGSIKTHPYRVKLAAGQARAFTENELGEIIRLLARTDEQLKTSSFGKEVALELFLLKLGSLAEKK